MHEINEYIDHSLIACMQAGADHHHQNSKNRKGKYTQKNPLPPPTEEKVNNHTR
jgi:hypothetical protein